MLKTDPTVRERTFLRSWIFVGDSWDWHEVECYWAEVVEPCGGAWPCRALLRGSSENAHRSQAGHNATRSHGAWGVPVRRSTLKNYSPVGTWSWSFRPSVYSSDSGNPWFVLI